MQGKLDQRQKYDIYMAYLHGILFLVLENNSHSLHFIVFSSDDLKKKKVFLYKFA